MSVDEARIIELPKFLDVRGNLSFAEQYTHIPFEIRRVYWLYDVPGGIARGGHAEKNNEELLSELERFIIVKPCRLGEKPEPIIEEAKKTEGGIAPAPEKDGVLMVMMENYDAKNMCECFRLIHMGMEIARGEGVKVNRRNIDREFLLDIKAHKFEYDYLINTYIREW